MESSSQNYSDDPVIFEEMLSYVIYMKFVFKLPDHYNGCALHISPDKKWAFWELSDCNGGFVTFNEDINYYLFSLADSKVIEVGSFYIQKDPETLKGSSGEWKDLPESAIIRFKDNDFVEIDLNKMSFSQIKEHLKKNFGENTQDCTPHAVEVEFDEKLYAKMQEDKEWLRMKSWTSFEFPLKKKQDALEKEKKPRPQPTTTQSTSNNNFCVGPKYDEMNGPSVKKKKNDNAVAFQEIDEEEEEKE